MGTKKQQPASVPVVVHEADQLLTLEEAARRLSLGRVTIRRMARRGELKIIRLGHNTLRVRESELDAYIASKAT
jgi:excisionase family DNA binding protein